MTQNELKYLVAESIGAQSENKEIVFRILTKKIANRLQPGEAVSIKNIGTFNKPKDEFNAGEKSVSEVNKLIFVPVSGKSDQAANSLFTTIPITVQKESGDFSADNIFEVGVSKPLPSIKSVGEGESVSLSLKEIDKRVDELLNSSEKIGDYSIWSRPIDEVSADDISADENIFNEKEQVSEDSSAKETLLGVAGLTAGETNDNESLELPDFESMEKDFISEIKSSESDEKIHIVSEDDIIVPGENKPTEEVVSEEDKLENVFDETESEKDSLESDEVEEESLDDIFKEFNSENTQVDFNEFDDIPLPIPSEESVSDDAKISDIKDTSVTDENLNEGEINEEHDPEVLALDSEDTIDDEDIAELNDTEIKDAIDNADTPELDALFEKAEEKISSIDDEEFKSEHDGTELPISDLEKEIAELDEDFDVSKGEYEIEHPDLEEEGIEITSATIDDVDLDEIKDETKLNETDADTIGNNENAESELAEDEEFEEAVTQDENIDDDNVMESSLKENEYSKLSSGADHSGGLGKGFWISVIVFIVVVVVGAYLYLFVYDTEDKGESVAQDPAVEQQVDENDQTENLTNDAAPTEGAKVEQETVESVQQTVPKKREVVRIQGQGKKELYRDGTGERLVSNTVFEKNGAYSVQVSSFKTQSVAEKDARRLQKLGYDAFIVKAFVAKLNAEYFRVRVGYFNTQKQAEEFSASFKR